MCQYSAAIFCYTCSIDTCSDTNFGAETDCGENQFCLKTYIGVGSIAAIERKCSSDCNQNSNKRLFAGVYCCSSDFCNSSSKPAFYSLLLPSFIFFHFYNLFF